MKNILTMGTLMFAGLLLSCKKEAPATGPISTPVETIRIDLGQKEIKYGEGPLLLDFDNDGTRDFIFNVTIVSDPLADIVKRKFMANSGLRSLFALNNSDESPCMNRGDSIPLQHFNGYQWNLVLATRLVERWENMAGVITWHGNWKGAEKKYLPFQLIIQNKPHAGWIELSIDVPNQKVLLHKAAYTKEPEKTIKAGE